MLFVTTGIGNGSTFRMIPVIFRAHHLRRAAGHGAEAQEQAIATGRREAAAVLGFSSAVGAFGGWLIPQGYGISTALTGGPQAALWCFIGFYVTCIGVTWWCYLRRSFAVRRVPSLADARA